MAIVLAVGRILLFALLGTTQLNADRGYATEFGNKTDLLAGGSMACSGTRMRPGELACAHRSLPCGTPLILQNQRNRKVAACVVMDRGPYGATLPNGEIILKIRPKEEGVWRGLVDVSPTVADLLDLAGRERVTMIFERPPKSRRVPQRLSRTAPSFGSGLGAMVSLFTAVEK